ncbi:energy transducer TonB [Methylotuvimicrobium sp. KM1]|uniref:energy transducer TonB n=1 Tax=Methylotuvimicrobium sp. KM1 TaxID=3377707 RepID=UPI0038512A3D
MKRLAISLLAGLGVTLALFWLMQAMVMNRGSGFKKTDNLQMVEFVRLKRESKPQIKEKKTVKPPPPPEKRPPPPPMQTQHTQPMAAAQPNLAIPNLSVPLPSARFGGSALEGLTQGAAAPSPAAPSAAVGTGTITTDVTPLVRIPPRYPMRAASRRIEGWVKVEFTITKTGEVSDAVVVESHPSNIFNREALAAVKRWKFKAKVVDGQAYEQRAQQTLEFKLSK